MADSREDEMVNSWGSEEAIRGSRSILHFPFTSVMVVFRCSENSTVTVAPGSVFPQIGTGCSRWSIIWSENRVGSASCAADDAVEQARRSVVQVFLIMIRILKIIKFRMQEPCTR